MTPRDLLTTQAREPSDLRDDWRNFLFANGLKEVSVRTYSSSLDTFVTFLLKQKGEGAICDKVRCATTQTIEEYKEYLIHQRYNASSIKLKLFGLTRLYSWMVSCGTISVSPIGSKIRRRPQAPERNVATVSSEQLDDLISGQDPSPQGTRNKALLELMRHSVQPLSYFCSLTVGDGKHIEQARSLPNSDILLAPSCVQAVSKLVDLQLQRGKEDSESLFSYSSQVLKRMTSRSLRRSVVANFAVAIGADPHTLSHSLYRLAICELIQRQGGLTSEMIKKYKLPLTTAEKLLLRLQNERTSAIGCLDYKG